MLDTRKPAAEEVPQSDSREWAEFLGSIVSYVEFRCRDPRRGYLDLMELAETHLARLDAGSEAGPSDLKDETMPEVSRIPKSVVRPSASRPVPLAELLAVVVDDPETWLATPSAQLGGRRPADLIDTDEEVKVMSLLQAVDQGLF